MIQAFDVDSYNKPGFNFGTAWAQGYRAGYIKLGGDNDGRYVGSSGIGYHGQFNAFAAQPFQHRGSYWVTGGSDQTASARFYLANLDPRTTFYVLDNETLDSGRSLSDAEACEWFDVLHNEGGIDYADMWQYGSRDSLWNAGSWSGLAARRIKAIVAIYNGTPFQNVYPRTYPADLVKGHQFTSSASIGGLTRIDANQFTDDAFTVAAPAPEIVMKRRKKMFGFLRGPDGSIYLINGENGTYRGLSIGEWSAYEASGAKYANADAAQVKETLGRLKAA